MAYEFTKAKIADERTSLIRRSVVAGLMGGLGLVLGAATNDMQGLGDVFVLSVIALASGASGFYIAR